MKIEFGTLKFLGLGLTAIGGLAALAGGFVEGMKNEAQIEEAVDRKVKEFMSQDHVVYLESVEEEETEEES